MINKHRVKSCCGSTSLILEMDKPIKKSHVSFFRGHGLVPDSMINAGIFYFQLGNMVGTGTFGGLKITVKCGGADCEKKVAEFEALLEKAINS